MAAGEAHLDEAEATVGVAAVDVDAGEGVEEQIPCGVVGAVVVSMGDMFGAAGPRAHPTDVGARRDLPHMWGMACSRLVHP